MLSSLEIYFGFWIAPLQMVKQQLPVNECFCWQLQLMNATKAPREHPNCPHHPSKAILIVTCWVLPYFMTALSPASLPPDSNHAVIYITTHIFQGINSQWSTCVPGDVLWWTPTKMNMWSAELRRRRGQGGNQMKVTSAFSKSEGLCLFERDIRTKWNKNTQGSCFWI